MLEIAKESLATKNKTSKKGKIYIAKDSSSSALVRNLDKANLSNSPEPSLMEVHDENIHDIENIQAANSSRVAGQKDNSHNDGIG